MSSCDCHIEVTDASQKGVLRKLLALNATMFVVELVVGIIGESTGVLADSLDMLADALVYSVALYAVGRCSSVKIKAAFLSGGFQLLIALGIGTDIVRRAITGSEPSSLLMFIVSIIALAVNAYCLKLISKEKEGEVHMRASYIFIFPLPRLKRAKSNPPTAPPAIGPPPPARTVVPRRSSTLLLCLLPFQRIITLLD